MDLKDYTGNENNWKFDFTLDSVKPCDDYYEEYKQLEPVNRFFEYQSEKHEVYDPDNYSELLQNIYKILWGDLWEGSELKAKFMTNHNWQYKWPKEDSKCKSRQPQIKSFQPVCSDNMTSQSNLTKTFFKNHLNIDGRSGIKAISVFYLENPSKLNKISQKDKGDIIEFWELSHTLGNYCPVPAGFNVGRSGPFARYDYWDLTLMKIKEYYDYSEHHSEFSKEELSLLELFHFPNANAILNCKAWLNSYGVGFSGWVQFIEKNFFNDYVDANYEVIPFFSGHSWESPQIPSNDPRVLREFLINLNKRIKSRGEKMFQKLCCGEKQ